MKRLIIPLIALAFSYSAFGQTAIKRDLPADFKTDGCTWFPDGDYRDCCVEHDKDYYFGGTLKERRESDKRLCECVKSKSKGWNRSFLASTIWLGVRAGGVSFLPTPFRWGFGNKYPRRKPDEKRIESAKKPSGENHLRLRVPSFESQVPN